MTFDEFISKYLGKKVDFDGAYGGQCVDLFRQYNKDVLGISQPRGVVGAADFWTNYDSDQNLKNNFEKIPNTPTGVPQKGDVMFWNKNAGGGFGHVAIYIEGNVNSFVSLDQNWPTLDKVTKTTHDYKNVLGWMRPKGGNMGELPANFGDIVKKSTNWDETHAYFELSGDPKDTSVEDVKQVVGGIKSTTTQAKNELAKVQKELAIANTEIANRIDQVANIQADCQRQLELKNAELSALKSTTNSVDKLRGQYEGTITDLNTQIRELQKAGGIKDTRITELETELEQAKKGIVKEDGLTKIIKIILETFKNIKPQ